MNEKINCQPWIAAHPPQKILFIRFQAMGDVMITLPYIQGVKKQLPHAEIDFLTRDENGTIPESIILFSNIYFLKGGRSTRKQALHALILAFSLRKRKYDAVVDLQNNRISRLMMKLLAPQAWSFFDRLSPIPAGARTANTIDQVLLKKVAPDFNFSLTNKTVGADLLHAEGWQEDQMLIVLNPAGFLTSRNWPLDNYIALSRLLQQQYKNARFVILGIDRIKSKAEYLKQQLGNDLIDLVGRTSPAEAFAVMQSASLVISEDSGLMHMAWISGKATVALFGSSRSDWSRPLGEHSICLSSADMECGECMQPECKFGDVRCLTRYTPEMVFDQASELVKRTHA